MTSLLAWARQSKTVRWLQQPTTVAGISVFVAAVSAIALKQATVLQAVPAMVGAIISMAIPDNSDAKSAAVAVAVDAVKALETKQIDVAKGAADVSVLIKALETQPTVSAK
jgi:hypothetical protein